MENDKLTDSEKFADVVDNFARRRDVVLVADHQDLISRKHTQPVGQERVIHPDPQSNLYSTDRCSI